MSHTLQIERLIDTVNQGTGLNVIQKDILPEKTPNNRAIKVYRETGKYDFRPEVYLEDYESETEYDKANVRDTNKLN